MDSSAATADLARLRELLAMTYTPEGIDIWLANAAKKGWTLDYQIKRAEFLATGNFS